MSMPFIFGLDGPDFGVVLARKCQDLLDQILGPLAGGAAMAIVQMKPPPVNRMYPMEINCHY